MMMARKLDTNFPRGSPHQLYIGKFRTIAWGISVKIYATDPNVR